MRFVDANVFLYAMLKPRRPLTGEEETRKQSAKRMFERIDEGEPVLTNPC